MSSFVGFDCLPVLPLLKLKSVEIQNVNIPRYEPPITSSKDKSVLQFGRTTLVWETIDYLAVVILRSKLKPEFPPV